jgi:hypothetical protein
LTLGPHMAAMPSEKVATPRPAATRPATCRLDASSTSTSIVP